MVRAPCYTLINSQASRTLQDPGDATSWVRALVRLRCRAIPSPSDMALAREDALREAAISLSLGDGLPFTGHEYQLPEQLRRIDP
jgi:hypothetical protein